MPAASVDVAASTLHAPPRNACSTDCLSSAERSALWYAAPRLMRSARSCRSENCSSSCAMASLSCLWASDAGTSSSLDTSLAVSWVMALLAQKMSTEWPSLTVSQARAQARSLSWAGSAPWPWPSPGPSGVTFRKKPRLSSLRSSPTRILCTSGTGLSLHTYSLAPSQFATWSTFGSVALMHTIWHLSCVPSWTSPP